MRRTVGASASAPLGVYVHVPFCTRRCDYCAFATWTDRHHLWARYAAACRTEVSQLARPSRGPVTSVFFGGGTPSLLPAEMLVSILEAIGSAFGLVPGAEVTVECNPGTVTSAKLAAYRAGGVTRLSFGVQSLVPHVLGSLGREHGPSDVLDAVRVAASEGYEGAYSVDLIYGAAGESMSDWEASLQGVLALAPSPVHVSAYALTIEAGTPLASQPERHPDDDDQAAKYLMAGELLGGAGLEWYEISNWARPGAECRHNQLYWAQGEYIGIGCAAHSHALLADGGARRWWNVRTPDRYCKLVEEGKPTEAAGETLSPQDRQWEALMLSLRTSAGVPADRVPATLYDAGLVRRGLGAETGRATLTARGRLLANEVAVRLQLDELGSGGEVGLVAGGARDA